MVIARTVLPRWFLVWRFGVIQPTGLQQSVALGCGTSAVNRCSDYSSFCSDNLVAVTRCRDARCDVEADSAQERTLTFGLCVK